MFFIIYFYIFIFIYNSNSNKYKYIYIYKKMNTYLKLSSVKNDNKNCNCISPFYIDSMNGLNPNTGREYSSEDRDALKTALFRISNAKGCNLGVCCDSKDPTSNPDPEFKKQIINSFPKIMPMYNRSTLTSIKLSKKANVSGSGWIVPTPYMICKISKATLTDTSDPNIKMATNLVNDCFTNNCSGGDQITIDNLLQSSKVDMKYTYVDDARVTQSIMDGNIGYVKEYIAKYKSIDSPLTNDDYNNRLIHIASQGKNIEILNMIIALKANINIKNKINETPIHFAVRSRNLDNIDILLTQGVDLSLANIHGETPMFYAMVTGNLSIIKMLYNNNSPLIGVDKDGNNLIHYCIKNCPAVNANFDNRDLNKNEKNDIIRFLIERGISTEQLNGSGISPLELTQREINREINLECANGIEKDNNDIQEFFFNIKPVTEGMTSGTSGTPSTTAPISTKPIKPKGTGAISQKQDVARYTKEHNELLEIQTLLFNNIIRNNPKKYGGYISVDDIPKGAPIEVLDTVCVGNNMTGNEDTDDCIAKGGSIVKIQNRTTKIKLELIPEEESKIDQVDQKDLYFKKIADKIPQPLPKEIKEYNNTLTNQEPKTTGISYNLGEASTNLLGAIEGSLGFNPQPTTQSNKTGTDTKSDTKTDTKPDTSANMEAPVSEDHPPMFDDGDEVVYKCKIDAIKNSEKTIPQSFFEKYKVLIIVLSIIFGLILIGGLIYYFYF